MTVRARAQDILALAMIGYVDPEASLPVIASIGNSHTVIAAWSAPPRAGAFGGLMVQVETSIVGLMALPRLLPASVQGSGTAQDPIAVS